MKDQEVEQNQMQLQCEVQKKDQEVEQNQTQLRCGVQKPVQVPSMSVEQFQVQVPLMSVEQFQVQRQTKSTQWVGQIWAQLEPVLEPAVAEPEPVELVAVELELVERVVVDPEPERADEVREELESADEEPAVAELVLVLVQEQAHRNLDSTMDQCLLAHQPLQLLQMQQLVAKHVAHSLRVVHEECEVVQRLPQCLCFHQQEVVLCEAAHCRLDQHEGFLH